MRYVLIHKFCAESGYSEKAVRRKIEEGVWAEGDEYRRAPDGKLLINTAAALQPAESAAGGVYLLMVAGEVAYVGKAINFASRIAAHRRARAFDEARLIPCEPATADWLERELIRTLEPKANLMRYKRHQRSKAAELEGAS